MPVKAAKQDTLTDLDDTFNLHHHHPMNKHTSRTFGLLMGMGVVVLFLGVVSLAPQFGDKFGQLSSKKQGQNAMAQTMSAGTILQHPVLSGGNYCGSGMATGDVNGDGKKDVIMGCYNDSPAVMWGAGSAVVFLSKSNTSASFNTGVVLRHPSREKDDQCGWSVASADINSDGKADVIMGCLGDGAGNEGSAVVFISNSTTSASFNPGVVLQASTAGDLCGNSVAAGDVNGDGKADVVMGCPGGSTGTGKAIVFLRKASNNGFESGVVLQNNSALAGDRCGERITAGDVNGDGKADVILGCLGDGVANAGSAAVFLSNSTTSASFGAGVIIPGTAVNDLCGREVAAGDVNGDGKADVVMGCPGGRGDAGSPANAGSAVVFLSNSTTSASFGAGVKVQSPAPVGRDYCGWKLSTGDVNGDGKADLVMSCVTTLANGYSDGGLAFVLQSRSTTSASFDAGVEIRHPAPIDTVDQCGWSTAAGDVNADGNADVVMGCINDDIGIYNDAGSAVVFLSGSSGPIPSTSPSPNPSPGPSPTLGILLGFDTGSDSDGDSMGLLRIQAGGECGTGGENAGILNDCVERFVGTNPLLNCGSGAWVPDLNNDLKVNLKDKNLMNTAIKNFTNAAAYNQRYDFNADHKVDNTDLAILESYVTLTAGRACASNATYVTASPNQCPTLAGQGGCEAVITWSTPGAAKRPGSGLPNPTICMNISGSGETMVSSGITGSFLLHNPDESPAFQPSETYLFKLYDNGCGSKTLAWVKLVVLPAPPAGLGTSCNGVPTLAFSWNEAAGAAKGYNIEVTRVGRAAVTQTVSIPGYSMNGKSIASYNWKVQSLGNWGNSAWVNGSEVVCPFVAQLTPSGWPADGNIGAEPVIHAGGTAIDILNVAGTPVFATMDGTISKYAASDCSGEAAVDIVNSLYTLHYCHLININVSEGQSVNAGKLLGYMSNTGDTQGTGAIQVHYAINGTNTMQPPLIPHIPTAYEEVRADF